MAAILAPVQGQVNAEVDAEVESLWVNSGGLDSVQSASGFARDLKGRLLRASFCPSLLRGEPAAPLISSNCGTAPQLDTTTRGALSGRMTEPGDNRNGGCEQSSR